VPKVQKEMLKYMHLPYAMDSNIQTAPRESFPFALTLENIGPLKEAQIELREGLYGLNGTGKTTVAKALRLLARLDMGAATAGDVIRLVKRPLKHMNRPLAEAERMAGRFVYRTADSELEVRCTPDVRGAKLEIGQWERYVTADELLPAVDKPRIVLFWVAHDSVERNRAEGAHVHGRFADSFNVPRCRNLHLRRRHGAVRRSDRRSEQDT
jgi:hypothetical protein